MKKRVVITGDGSISPLGLDSKSLWKNLLKGHSGVDLIQQFDTEKFSVKIAGEVKNFDPFNFFDAKEVKNIKKVFISQKHNVDLRILHDKTNSMEDKYLKEQFSIG